MNYVFDSSSLMYLGKINILDKIKFIGNKNFIPKNVYEEVIIKGLERKEPEINYLNKLIENGLFIIEEGKNILNNMGLLSEADKEVISLAKEIKAIAIIDEAYARKIARSLNIQVHGSAYIIIKLLKKKIINKEKAINCLDKIIYLGFYPSTKKYKEIIEIIEKLEQ